MKTSGMVGMALKKIQVRANIGSKKPMKMEVKMLKMFVAVASS